MSQHESNCNCKAGPSTLVILFLMGLGFGTDGQSQDSTKQGSSSVPASGSKVARVNLLEHIDVGRDAVNGTFRLQNGTLYTGVDGNSRLSINYEVPRDYDLNIDVVRPDGGGHFCVFLLLEGQQVLVMVDAFGMQKTGIAYVDGQDLDGDRNKTVYQQAVLTRNVKHQLCYSVRGSTLKISVDGKKIFDWHDELSRITLPSFWKIPNTKALMIGGATTAFEISRLELVNISNPNKPPLPKEAQIDEARKTIRQLFKKDYDQAKSAKARIALAQTLIGRVAELENDPSGLYALLADAAENAAAGGELLLALKAVQQVDEYFATPAFDLKEKVGKAAISQAKTPDQIIQVVELYQSFIHEALAADEIDAAERYAQVVQVVSRKPGMGMLKEQMAGVTKDLISIESTWEASEPAHQKLRKEPDDPAANLTWGKYTCFIKDDWQTGLPLLMKSKDPVLAELAQRDLNQAADVIANIKLGDDWWAIAAKEKEPARTRISGHAVEAYYRAWPQLTGLDRASVESKIFRLFGSAQVFTAKGDATGTVVADASLNFGTNATIECWMQVPSTSDGIALLSKRHLITDGTLAVGMRGGRVGLFETAGGLYNEQISQQIVTDDRWHHLAIVKAGTNVTLFYDGTKIAALTCRDDFTSKSPWKIGAAQDYIPTALRACKVRISNGARYIVSFRPDCNYKRDRATVYLSDAK